MQQAARFFKILADETRLRILWLLHNERELCVCDMVEVLGITQSKASRHLTTLRHAGLVTDRREGTWSYYSLCVQEDGLARDQVEALWPGLSARPEAAAALATLRQWMAAKDGRAACSERPRAGG